MDDLENQLSESESLYNEILYSLNAHIAVIDERGDIIAVNKAWVEFGLHRGVRTLALIARGSNYFEACRKAISKGDAKVKEALEGIEAVLRNEMPYFEQEYPCHFHTHKRWFLFRVTSFYKDGPKAVISHEDITSRKLAEQEVLKSVEEKKAILDSIHDGFFAVDQGGKVTYWNDKAEVILQKPKAEMLNKKLWDVFDDATQSIFHAFYDKAVEEKADQHFEAYYENLHAWYEVSVFPSRKGISVYLKDISARKSYVETIREQNRKLREIAYIQSHVVRAPLASLMGIVLILQQSPDSEPLRQELLSYLLSAANELDQQIRNICNRTEDGDIV
jgi:PAS domain S-box-containing protein